MNFSSLFGITLSAAIILAVSNPALADTKIDGDIVKNPVDLNNDVLNCHPGYDPTVKFHGIEDGATYQANQVLSIKVTISCFYIKFIEDEYVKKGKPHPYQGVTFAARIRKLPFDQSHTLYLASFPALSHPFHFEVDLRETVPGEYALVLGEPDDWLFSTHLRFNVTGNFVTDREETAKDRVPKRLP